MQSVRWARAAITLSGELTVSGRRIDSTVEAAVRRSLARADDLTTSQTKAMLAILTDERVKED